MKAKKEVIVSEITKKDKQVFEKAYEKLKSERAKTTGPTRRALKKLASSRTIRSQISMKYESSPNENYVKCPIDYAIKTKKRERSVSRTKTRKVASAKSKTPVVELQPPKKVVVIKPPSKPKKKVAIKKTPSKPQTATQKQSEKPSEKPEKNRGALKEPQEAAKEPQQASKDPQVVESNSEAAVDPEKRKTLIIEPRAPPKRVLRPVIKIPPIKTRPWNPKEVPKPIPRVKPVINYPEVKRR
jgi:hypothetical protein